MQDLTQGPIPRHLIGMALPIAIGMLFQTAYVLIDLYFVARLGDSAIAGVGTAANAAFVVMALTQVLGVGTVSLIARAVGARDFALATLGFNQSLTLSAIAGLGTLLAGWLGMDAYMNALGADPATVAAGKDYLHWYLPGLALQFAMVALGSALRGTGTTKPTMLVQMVTVVINAILAPVLVAGWGTGKPMGVAGAGLASSIAIAVGVVLLWWYFRRLEHVVRVRRPLLKPQWPTCRRILAVGLPAGGEFALMFVYMALIYYVTREFGAAAQAGFGAGQRVMQAVMLPAMAVAFAVTPLAGQNFGARRFDRVRESFKSAALLGSALMLALTVLCQWQAEALLRPFSSDPQVLAHGVEFLHYIALNFVTSGLVFTISGMFQALGNSVPALISSATRLLTFSLPLLWLAAQPGFALTTIWKLSIASVLVQVSLSWWLLRREFARKLRAPAPAVTDPAAA